MAHSKAKRKIKDFALAEVQPVLLLWAFQMGGGGFGELEEIT